jgi:farnesyl diphosphate synthase
MVHGVLGGGKRLRPLVVIACAECVAKRDVVDEAMPSALAVEYVHSYSLIHDDLPALDNDDTRRGQPTVHKAFDHATAVLAGDALLTDAFAILATSSRNTAQQVRELATAAGSAGMVGGQYDDVQSVERALTDAELTRIHARKTGALFAASAAMGAWCAGASPETAASLRTYGAALGLAFQIRDDVLDAQGFATLLGPDDAQRRAQHEAETAARIAESLGSSLLAELARFSATRSL